MLDLITLKIMLELSHRRIILFIVTRIRKGNSLCRRPLAFLAVELFKSLEIWLRILFAIELTWCVFIHFGRGKRIPINFGISLRSLITIRHSIFPNCYFFKFIELQRCVPSVFKIFVKCCFRLNLGRNFIWAFLLFRS